VRLECIVSLRCCDAEIKRKIHAGNCCPFKILNCTDLMD
jgi:hypothetical protein